MMDRADEKAILDRAKRILGKEMDRLAGRPRWTLSVAIEQGERDGWWKASVMDTTQLFAEPLSEAHDPSVKAAVLAAIEAVEFRVEMCITRIEGGAT